MLVIGERINSSRGPIREAIEGHDAAFVAEEARRQREAGADLIDVNAGAFVGTEINHLRWLVETVQEAVDAPLCIDSPDPAAMAAVLPLVRQGAMLNSVSLEPERYDRVVPLALEHRCRVVALCLDEEGMPDTAQERFDKGARLVERLAGDGVPLGDIYVDPVVTPVSTRDGAGWALVEAVGMIRKAYPGIHAVCGLSNVSYGLPVRKLINRSFLVLTMGSGLDAVILDPLDRGMMGLLRATWALLGRDEYCTEYLGAFRAGRLEGAD